MSDITDTAAAPTATPGAQTGFAGGRSPAGAPTSVGAMLARQIELNPDREAYRFPRGDEWVSLTWKQTGEQVDELAGGLLALGLHTEDRVAIAADCRLEWVLADHAVMCAGCATTTVYPNTQAEDVAFILSNSGSRVLFAENQTQVDKALDRRGELTDLIKIVLFDGEPRAEDGDIVITLDRLREIGRQYLSEHPDAVTEAIAATGPESLATLIYTSGTTGQPKGVRLVHDNWVYLGEAVDEMGILDIDDVQYLWLPLSHVFGKCLIAIQLHTGFATAVDGRIDKIVEGLGTVKPTFMAGAPRIFEKVRARVTMQASSGIKAKIFAWALRVGAKTVPMRLEGKQPTGLLKAQYALATKLVFSKLTATMGGRVRFFISGSAALSREVQEWFYAAGLTVVEGYGLTETSAATCVALPWSPRFGTVGPPLPGTEIKIAEDGEILVRGRAVMRGYHDNPEATAEALDGEGFFHTGDIGELVDGRLRVTDRKKDLIKTSGGKYVAPQKVEGVLKATCPYLSQVLVHGEGRKFITALLELDPDAMEAWAKDNGHADQPYVELAASDDVYAMIEGYVNEANAKLARWETIKRFAILPSELSVDSGEITPSMKLRRRAIEKNYTELLDGLYPKD